MTEPSKAETHLSRLLREAAVYVADSAQKDRQQVVDEMLANADRLDKGPPQPYLAQVRNIAYREGFLAACGGRVEEGE